MNVADALRALDTIAPRALALPDDPGGLLVGDPTAPLERIVVALDATLAVAEAARSLGAGLIVAHHPLVYHPLRAVRADEPIGAVVLACARANVAVAAAHTNWDVAGGGVNDVLADLLGLSDTRPLRVTYRGPLGEQGIGRIGGLPAPIAADVFHGRVRETLRFEEVRMVGPRARAVRTVAVCGGAGAFLMGDALAGGADAFVTSDVRHHEFVEAGARGLLLLDAGHAATETPGTRELARRLGEALAPGGVEALFLDPEGRPGAA